MLDKQHEAEADRVLGNSGRSNTRREPVLATVAGERFLSFKDVSRMTSLHVATLYRKIAAAKDKHDPDPYPFWPQPVQISANRVGFRESDVAKWMAERKERTPAKRPVKPRLGSSPLRELAGGGERKGGAVRREAAT